MSVGVTKKWSNPKLGGLAIGQIEDSHIRKGAAQLLENQSAGLSGKLFESFNTGVGASGANSPVPSSGNGQGIFAPVSMALVRRTFPNLFAHKVVGVQPMATPVGLAYALRFTYGSSDNEAAWNEVPKYSGFTGSTRGTSGTADEGIGADTDVAESWAIPGSGPTAYPDIGFRLDRTAIVAQTRKLAASFSIEAAQDIQAMHNVDIEKEIVQVLEYEVQAELDRELLNRMKMSAIKNYGTVWADVPVFDADTAGDGRWQQEKLSGLATKIIDLANEVAISTKRGAGNFVIVSPKVATALQASNVAFSAVDTSKVKATDTMAEIGTLNGNIKVYRDQYAGASDYALVGFKGNGISDCGLIYSPYVTGVTNKAISDEDFSPRIGVMSRYAITDSLNGTELYYRAVRVTNLAAVLS